VPDNLDAPVPGPGRVTGSWGSRSKSASVYTQVFGLHPGRARLLGLLGLGAAAWLTIRRRRA
jgi:hypothetical protein